MSYKPPSDFEQSDGGQLEEDQQNLEMFLLQIPKKFDITQLNGVKYIPGQIIDVASDDNLPGQLSAVYQLAASTMQDLDLKPLVKHKKEAIVGQAISGHLSVTKTYSIESKPSRFTLPNLNRSGPSLVPMPTGLRERFTPFGSGSPRSGPRLHKHSKHHKLRTDSTPSTDELPEKRKKKKKRKDADQNDSADAKLPDLNNHDSGEILNSPARLGDPNESAQEVPGDETSPVREKRKKKKQKRSKERGEEGREVGPASPLPNGCLDMSGSQAHAHDELKGILSHSAKWKKHKKNVSFSQDDSIFMNSSGDASRLSPERGMKEEKLFHDPQDVNGNSETPERVKTGKKRKLSSGYSSVDTSLEINSPLTDNGERPVKKKKKKHKAMHEDL